MKAPEDDAKLLLAQLREAQKELATLKRKFAAAETRAADAILTRRQQVDTLKAARSEQAKLAKKRLEQVEHLQKARTALEAEHAHLEQVCIGHEQVLAAQRDEIESLKRDNKTHAKAVRAAESQRKAVSHHNELLRQQLRQVQNELEHYFHLHQEIRRQLSTAEERWHRVLQHNPAYFDFATLECVQRGDERSTWLLKDFNGAGRRIPELRFQTVMENNCAGLILARGDDGKSPLLRWPAPQLRELRVVLSGDAQQLQECVSVLLNLCERDWVLVQLLVQALGSALEKGAVLRLPADAEAASLHGAVQMLSGLLQQFPDTPRFETLVLRREQVNADYEHLAFRLGNLSLGKQRWPVFEFRLSCANVGPQDFGRFPKLEFPQDTGQAPFDSWFAEAQDDFGAKLELRFGPDAMDLAVWRKLSAHDRQFVDGLVRLLPTWLNALRQDGQVLKRPWDEWLAAARTIQQLMLRYGGTIPV